MRRTGSLSFWLTLYDSWPIYHQQSTDIPLTVNGQCIGRVSVTISADSRTIKLCWPALGLYRGQYIGQYVDRHISVDRRPSVSRYVDQHIGWVSVDILADTSVDYRLICRPIYRLRGAQNTHDPISLCVLHLDKTSTAWKIWGFNFWTFLSMCICNIVKLQHKKEINYNYLRLCGVLLSFVNLHI